MHGMARRWGCWDGPRSFFRELQTNHATLTPIHPSRDVVSGLLATKVASLGSKKDSRTRRSQFEACNPKIMKKLVS
jgi:hypothetical protein